MKRKNTTSIKINDRWEIRSDPYCWIVVEHIPVDKSHHMAKGQRETKEFHTYHGNIAQCCQYMLKEAGKDDCSTLGEVLGEQKRLNEQIISVLQ